MKLKRIFSFLLLFMAVIANGGQNASAQENKEETQTVFENMEVIYPKEEIPSEFHDVTYRKNAASAEAMGYSVPLFLSDKFGFELSFYETGDTIGVKYGRDLSSKGGEYLNVYYTAPSNDILASEKTSELYNASLKPVIKALGVDEAKLDESLKKGIQNIKSKKDENIVVTSGDYEITIAPSNKKTSSVLLISFKNLGKKPFKIKELKEAAEKILGPAVSAENYHSFTVKEPLENTDSLVFENMMTPDREYGTYRARAVLTAGRTNESVIKFGMFPGAQSESLATMKETIQNDFVNFANSVSMVPMVRESGSYKIQFEQNLNNRDKITLTLDGTEEFIRESETVENEGE